MNKKTRQGIALLAIAIAGWMAVRYFSDEARIRRSWKGVAAAVAEEKVLALGSHISRRYGDPWGQSYESLLGAAYDLFSTYQDLRFAHTVESVSVSGSTAAVSLSFRLYGSRDGNSGLLLGESGTPCTATIEMRKEGGNWIIERVTGAEIPNAGGRTPGEALAPVSTPGGDSPP